LLNHAHSEKTLKTILTASEPVERHPSRNRLLIEVLSFLERRFIMLPIAQRSQPSFQDPCSSRTIQEGDLVIVYESHMAMKALVVRKDGVFSNRFGQFLVKARRHRESRREGKNFCAAPPNLAVSLSCSAP
jgi:hypothetical protein